MAETTPPPERAAQLVGLGAVPSTAAASRTAGMQFAARGALLLVAVVGTALVTRDLGTDYAAWGTVLIAVTLSSVLLEPGFTPVIARRLAASPETAPSPGAMLFARLVLGVSALGVVVLASVVSRGAAILPLALLLGGQVVARSLVNNAGGWLLADQRMHRIAVLEVGVSVLGLGALAVAISFDAPAPLLGAVGFTIPYILLAIASIREIRATPSARVGTPSPQWPRVKSLLLETLPLSGAIALGAIYTRSSVYFVNRFEGDTEASKFFFAFLFAEQTLTVAGITAGAALPLLAHRTKSLDILADPRTSQLVLAVTAAGAALSALLLASAGLLTRLVGGPALEGAEYYIRLVAPLAAVIMPAMVLAYMYISLQKARRYLAFGILGLLLNFSLNLAFVPTFGAAASARITWSTELLVTLLPLAPLMRASRAGRRASLGVLGLIAMTVILAELSASGGAPALLPAALLLSVAVVVGLRPMLRVVRDTTYV